MRKLLLERKYSESNDVYITGGHEKMNKNICVICEHGWIIKGVVSATSNETNLILNDASVVRSWHNGRGIGGIVRIENKDEYILDYIGDVSIYRSKILFEIPCEW